MAKISRQRGATYEREVANEIFDMLGVRIKRNLKQCQQADEGDLLLGDYLIECKRRKAIAVHEFMGPGLLRLVSQDRTPVVIMRADGKKSLAVLHLPDLLKLIAK